MLRQKILKKCREDIYAWLNHENGQVAIYDAVNPTSSGRRSLAKEFAKHDVQTLFLESYVNDQAILQENARNVKISSPDVGTRSRALEIYSPRYRCNTLTSAVVLRDGPRRGC